MARTLEGSINFYCMYLVDTFARIIARSRPLYLLSYLLDFDFLYQRVAWRGHRMLTIRNSRLTTVHHHCIIHHASPGIYPRSFFPGLLR